ncbi:MAG: hypothetical protein ROR55_02325 [Devosia sp.]
MTDSEKTRQDRLAAALRDNLKRRKDQARARADTDPPKEATPEPSPKDG